MENNASSQPIIYNFHVTLLLVNEMISSELCQQSSRSF